MQAQDQMYEQETTGKQVSGWAIGFTYFAAILMMLMGAFHIIAGITGIFEDEFFVLTQEYTFKADATTWGWIHLVGGIIVLLAGFGLLSGAIWARIIAIIAVVLSIIGNFAYLPYYPAWSILMIAVGVGVIWALTVHGRDVAVAATEREMQQAPDMAGQGTMAQGTGQRMSPAGQGGSDPEPMPGSGPAQASTDAQDRLSDSGTVPPAGDQGIPGSANPQQLQDRPPSTPS